MKKALSKHIGECVGEGGREEGPSAAQSKRTSPLMIKLVTGSQVGQVRPVNSCGQVGDLDPSLVKSPNLLLVGQVRPVDPSGHFRNIDPSGSK